MTDLEIFHAAPEDATPKELAAYLDKACGDDQDLRASVEALLNAEDDPTDFLEAPPLQSGEDSASVQMDLEGPGTVIGNYKLLQEIGAGGFGIVYMAEQLQPVKRRVALKVIKLGMDTRQVVARFEVERQALAMMDHPNIAKVFDAGATGTGRPYFVMELVRGISITQYCTEKNLDTAERLQLFIDVCSAVQHAHQKGIIHRDLKPSNVMITMHDDKAVPKVIDFGVAKATQADLTDKTLYTRYEQFIGTPAYMSPEQAQLSGLDIDTRSDIYSLGVLLYELLTGTTPFDAKELERAGEAEIRRKIREDDPPKPSTRLSTCQSSSLDQPLPTNAHALRGDLDWIVMKALEKDRVRRYDTANGLAMDIQRHLDDQPIRAAAPSTSYRMGKYVRRHRAALSTAAALLTVLIAGLGVSIWQAVVAKQATRDKGAALVVAETAQEHLERDQVLDQFRLAEEFFAAGKADLGVAYLADLLHEDPHNQIAAERLISALIYRDFPQLVMPLRSPDSGLRIGGLNVRFNADRTKLLGTISDADKVCRWDLETGKREVLASDPRHGRNMTAAVSEDEKWVAIALNGKDRLHKVVVWDVLGKKVVRERDHAQVDNVIFDRSGERLVSLGRNGVAKLWAAPSWEQVGDNLSHRSEFFESPTIWDADFSPDGQMVVTCGEDSTARIWMSETGEPKEDVPPLTHESSVFSVKFSPDGEYVATASIDHTAQVWSVASGSRQGKTLQHEARVNRIVFSPDGTLVATASADHTVRLWDAMTGEQLIPPIGHDRAVWRVRFNQRGDRLLTSAGGDAQIWDVTTGVPLGAKLQCGNFLGNVLFGADDAVVATVSHADDSALWAAPFPRPLSMVLRHPISYWHLAWGGRVNSARFSADGSRLVTATRARGFKVWDVRTGKQVGSRIPNGRVGWGIEAFFNPDDPAGNSLVTTSRTGTEKTTSGLMFWELGQNGSWHSPRSYGGFGVRYAEFSPDGSLLLSSVDSQPTVIRDAKSGREISSLGQPGITTPQGGLTRSLWAHFDPSGKRVIAPSGDHAVRVFSAADEAVLTPPLLHGASIEGTCFSPDGNWVATASRDGTARVWNSRTGDRRDFVLRHSEAVNHISFSPDGYRLLTASNDGTARLWDAQTGKAIGFTMHHGKGVSMAKFSPDGKRIGTASYDETARLWDAETGLPLSEPLRHDDWVMFVEFSPDGTLLATTGEDGTARLWAIPAVPPQVPDWFLDWAETIGGKQIIEGSTATSIAWEKIRSTREKEQQRDGSGFYERIVNWFYDDANTRTITPFASIGIEDYVNNQIKSGELESLYDAVQIDPSNLAALLALSERLRTDTGTTNPADLWRAKFYAGQVLKIDPGNFRARQQLLKLERGEDLKVIATLVPPDSEWRWLHPLDRVDPAEADPDFHRTFMNADYDDSAWQTGMDRAGDTGGFGYGNAEWFDGVHIGTPEGEWQKDGLPRYAAYFRHRFTTTEAHQHLELHCQRDDGIIIYLDGVEIGGDNMPTGVIGYRSPAVRTIGGQEEQNVCRIPLDLPEGLPPGEHVLAISLHNHSKPSSDLRIGGITLVEVGHAE